VPGRAVGVGRLGGLFRRILLQFFKEEGDGLLDARVPALDDKLGQVPDLDVGRDALALDRPAAFRIDDPDGRNADGRAVDEAFPKSISGEAGGGPRSSGPEPGTVS
jgi:hypothetical protein